MIRTRSTIPKLFDCFWFLGQKLQKQLKSTWAEAFRRYILPKLPVKELSQSYRQDRGRPTKNLQTGLGLLVLQQMHDTTDEETVQRLAYDLRWQYALDIQQTSDEELYMCPRTLWGLRQKAMDLHLEEGLFAAASDGLIRVGGVPVGNQRMDSVHVQSNMKRLGRLRLMGRTVQAFLKNLRRKEPGAYARVEEEVRKRYVEIARGEEIFSRVKPSETAKSMGQAAQDLQDLVAQFAGEAAIEKMTSYRTMRRVLGEQCRLVEGEGEVQVEVKAAKEVGGDSVQNPSDVEAGYSGHKGQGYAVQVMETFTPAEEAKVPRLITYVEVTSAAVTDHHAVVPALEAVEERKVQPQQLLADTLYGSDDNVAKARGYGVELIAPVNSQEGKSGRMPLSSFRVNAEDEIVECPGGQTPQRVKREKEVVTVWFDRQVCEGCAHRGECPVLWSKKRIRLPYELKSMRSSRRRREEAGPEFREKYRWRSGIEGTMSEWDRRTGVKHLRVRGMSAVRFSVFLKALALNVFRFTAWMARGGKPVAVLLTFFGAKGSRRGCFYWVRSLLAPIQIPTALFSTQPMGCPYF